MAFGIHSIVGALTTHSSYVARLKTTLIKCLYALPNTRVSLLRPTTTYSRLSSPFTDPKYANVKTEKGSSCGDVSLF